MPSLFEELRPRTWGGLCGQHEALAKIKALRPRGFGGRAFWISGPSGTGKSTIARLLASEIADTWGTFEEDAKQLTPKEVEEIERRYRLRAMGKGGWGIIVNEAHGLSRPCVTHLLTVLERIPRHVLWIFTTTDAGLLKLCDGCLDAHPLLSRCTILTTKVNEVAFANVAHHAARMAGLDGAEFAAYVALVKECKGNLRAVLSEIEAGRMVSR